MPVAWSFSSHVVMPCTTSPPPRDKFLILTPAPRSPGPYVASSFSASLVTSIGGAHILPFPSALRSICTCERWAWVPWCLRAEWQDSTTVHLAGDLMASLAHPQSKYLTCTSVSLQCTGHYSWVRAAGLWEEDINHSAHDQGPTLFFRIGPSIVCDRPILDALFKWPQMSKNENMIELQHKYHAQHYTGRFQHISLSPLSELIKGIQKFKCYIQMENKHQ